MSTPGRAVRTERDGSWVTESVWHQGASLDHSVAAVGGFSDENDPNDYQQNTHLCLEGPSRLSERPGCPQKGNRVTVKNMALALSSLAWVCILSLSLTTGDASGK